MMRSKDDGRTGQEEDSRGGGLDRRAAAAGSAVWETLAVINYNGCRNYNYTSPQRVAEHFSFPQRHAR